MSQHRKGRRRDHRFQPILGEVMAAPDINQPNESMVIVEPPTNADMSISPSLEKEEGEEEEEDEMEQEMPTSHSSALFESNIVPLTSSEVEHEYKTLVLAASQVRWGPLSTMQYRKCCLNCL